MKSFKKQLSPVKKGTSFGCFARLIKEDATIVVATVINQIGMGGDIRDNILVSIAKHQDYPGKGLVKTRMQKAIAHAVAILHCRQKLAIWQFTYIKKLV